MSINRVVISGNLTRDPELKATKSGTAVLSIGLAVNERRKSLATGEWEDVPNFVDCIMFGSRAQAIARYLAKGSKVAIEGKLRYRDWEDQQTGKKRSKLGVVVDEIEFLSRNQQGQGYGQQQYGQQGYAAQAPAPAPTYAQPAPVASAPAQTVQPAADFYDEDIPF